MSTVKNFVIRNQNTQGEWETLYPRTSAAQVVTDESKQFVTATQVAAIDGLTASLAGVQEAAKNYTDAEIAKLVDSAPEAVNTLGELAIALQEHEDEYDALLEVVGAKATKEELTNGLALKADVTYVDEQLALKATKEELTNGLATKVEQQTLTDGLALKADVTYVDGQLANKVEATYVNEQLALKADLTHVDGQLALKATKEELTNGLATKVEQQALTDGLALKADKTQVASDIAAAVAGVTTVVVGSSQPPSAKPGDFWYEIIV